MGNPRQLELHDGQRETGMTLETHRKDQSHIDSAG